MCVANLFLLKISYKSCRWRKKSLQNMIYFHWRHHLKLLQYTNKLCSNSLRYKASTRDSCSGLRGCQSACLSFTGKNYPQLKCRRMQDMRDFRVDYRQALRGGCSVLYVCILQCINWDIIAANSVKKEKYLVWKVNLARNNLSQTKSNVINLI